jgi:hypothetical protein
VLYGDLISSIEIIVLIDDAQHFQINANISNIAIRKLWKIMTKDGKLILDNHNVAKHYDKL